jgi:hypothetical protein
MISQALKWILLIQMECQMLNETLGAKQAELEGLLHENQRKAALITRLESDIYRLNEVSSRPPLSPTVF